MEADDYRNACVLVLGASGFIGRWVARALTQRSVALVLGVRDRAKADAVFARYGVEGTIHVVDLSRPGAAAELVARTEPSITFNLAGYGVDPSERDAGLASRLNAELVHELACAISRHCDPEWSGQHLVHVGSALEYGGVSGDLSDPWHCRPTTLYGRTKLVGSGHVFGAVRRAELRGLTARLFTVYGPGEHSGRLLPALLEAARSGEELRLTAGAQRRDFTHVADVAAGLLRLGAQPEIVSEGALNLATGRLEPVRRFVEIACEVLGITDQQLKFGALPARPEEMVHDPVSVDRLRQLVGWTPATGIAEGVRCTLRFERRRPPE